MSYALIRARREARLDLGAFAREGGTHPELIRRLVVLGLLDARQDPSGELWFPRGQLAALGRVQRLHAGFAMNYAAIGLVTDLLDRIAALEAALRSAHISQGDDPSERRASHHDGQEGDHGPESSDPEVFRSTARRAD